MYQDRTVVCADCSQEFVFTAGEQQFYAQKGFTEPPKRCPSCRQVRKTQRGAGGGAGQGASGGGSGFGRYESGGYGGYSGGGGGYGSRGGYGSSGESGGYDTGERRPRQMYDAVCANCGRTAQVPFQPTGSRPVYCSDCFQSRR